MHKNPNERIKIPQIKQHPWFSIYKVSFQEVSPEVAMRQSNLITDSMIAEGYDPFDDFMNKRLNASTSSGRKSQNDSEDSLNVIVRDFGSISAIEDKGDGKSVSFKKQDRNSELSNDVLGDQLKSLEMIPEEKLVNQND